MSQGSILLVDDDQSALSSMRDYLNDENFSVTAVTNYTTAIGSIRRQPPDVVITDVELGDQDGFDLLKVCTKYKLNGEEINHLPASTVAQGKVEPIYETLEGWSNSTRGARSWADLPATAVKYVRRIEELIEAPVTLLSTSPEREDTILVHDPFAD